MRKLLLLLLACSISLVGCKTTEDTDDMFIISYVKDDATKIAYDTNGNNYIVSENALYKTDELNLTQAPALLYSPIHWDYKITENFQGNYSCHPTDAFAYITKLEETGYIVTQTYASPEMAIIKVDGNIHYIFYVEPTTTRVYCVNSNNKPVDPVIE